MGLNPIWGLDFAKFPMGSINISFYICIYHSHIHPQRLSIKLNFCHFCTAYIKMSPERTTNFTVKLSQCAQHVSNCVMKDLGLHFRIKRRDI